MQNNTPSTLYHYCSVETFFHIIKNKTLRLSDISLSNDSMELKWVIDIATEILNEKYNLERFTQSNPQLFDLLYKRLNVEIHALIPKIFAVCFSEENDLLSQWREYSLSGTGVCIGFNVASLNSKLLRWEKVEYNLDIQKDFISTLISDYFKNGIKNNCTSDAGFVASEIFAMLTSFKNPSFQEEKEYRLVYGNSMRRHCFVHTDEAWSKVSLAEAKFFLSEKTFDNLKVSPIDFSTKNNLLVSHLNLSFENKVESVITNIYLGPKCPLEVEDIRQFLYFNNFPYDFIKISKSASSYR